MPAYLYPIFQKLAIDAPHEPGVYMLLSGDRPLYIGMATNLFKRLLNHNVRDMATRNGLTEIRTIVISDPIHRAMTEKWLISKHRPLLNRAVPASNPR